MNYDNNLLELQQKVAHKKRLEAKLNDLREQRKVYDKQAMNKLTSLDQAADKQIAALKAKIEELVIHS